ncbi:hypothetical protein UFOVP141_31 [uncultured Caudovirales phage]|uniref:Uncharacterized protein n=1 Tax=uncultured Caudovirales phage TaxID=2100421 RepID=A0A6J7VL80_9CAUD|nr:hypothetical protein UFOVP141_31 [uncultured Caudovirales phage]
MALAPEHLDDFGDADDPIRRGGQVTGDRQISDAGCQATHAATLTDGEQGQYGPKTGSTTTSSGRKVAGAVWAIVMVWVGFFAGLDHSDHLINIWDIQYTPLRVLITLAVVPIETLGYASFPFVVAHILETAHGKRRA